MSPSKLLGLRMVMGACDTVRNSQVCLGEMIIRNMMLGTY